MPEDQVRQLQWVGGFNPLKELGNSRYSKILLKSDLHGAFEKGQWILLPNLATFKRIFDYSVNLKNTRDPAKWVSANQEDNIENLYEKDEIFEYYLVPLSGFTEPFFSNVAGAGEFVGHSFPFSSLGPLKSHVYPHYVILDCAQKFTDGRSRADEATDIISEILQVTTLEAALLVNRIIGCYSCWRNPNKPQNFRNRPVAGNAGSKRKRSQKESKTTKRTRTSTDPRAPADHDPEVEGSASYGRNGSGNQDCQDAPEDACEFDENADPVDEENPGLVDDETDSDEESYSSESADVEEDEEYLGEVNDRISNWCARSEAPDDLDDATAIRRELDELGASSCAELRSDLDYHRREKVSEVEVTDPQLESRRRKVDSHLWTTYDWMAHYLVVNHDRLTRERAQRL